MSVLSHVVATSPRQLLSTRNVSSVTEELNFKIYFISIN